MNFGMSENNKISTGSYDFNKWLEGGYEKDIINMIAGPPGSGKTNLCILAACSQAKRGNKVIYMDSEGGFSVERVRQIIGPKYHYLLENFLLLQPTSFKEQKDAFFKLLEHVKGGEIGLIIIDSMAMLYRLELGKDENKVKEINREVALQMRILSELSRKKNIPIVITNQVYTKFNLSDDETEPETKIVGGDLFRYWSKCIIELRKEGGKRKAILLKHRSLPQKEISFEIRNEGIFKKGWL